MRAALLVGLGGFAGSVLRYLLSGAVQQWSGSASFPWGTFAVNLLGCLLIGFLVELAESHGMLGASSRLFLLVGVLGGFTTFSAFGNETMNLVRASERTLAFANVVLHLVVAIGAVWVGRTVVRLIWR